MEAIFNKNEYGLTSSKVDEHSHHSPTLARCALCLIGLKKDGSNYDKCLDMYKKLKEEIDAKGPFRGGRTSAMVAAVVFSQRLGCNRLLSNNNDKETIDKLLKAFKIKDQAEVKKSLSSINSKNIFMLSDAAVSCLILLPFCFYRKIYL